MPPPPVVGHLGGLVQLAAHTMPHQLPHHAVALRLCMRLDGVTDVARAVAVGRRGDAALQTLLCHVQERPHFGLHLSDPEGVRTVTIEAVHEHTAVDARHAAILQDAFAREPMHHLVVHADEQGAGASVEPLEARHRSVVADELLRDPVQVGRARTGRDVACHFGQGPSNKQRTLPHQCDLLLAQDVHGTSHEPIRRGRRPLLLPCP